MFKQRFFTALLLIPLVLWGILYAHDPALVVIIGGITFALAWEWTALIPLSTRNQKCWFLFALIGAVGLFYWPQTLTMSLGLNSLLWLAILGGVVTYPNTCAYWGRVNLMRMVAWFSLSLFAGCLWTLFHQEQGRFWLIYLLGLVWAADIGAYMFGKLWGKQRLIPHVSPGKTVEGTLGGLVLGSAIATLGGWYFHPESVLFWFVQAWFVIGISMLGDLWISMLKRRVQIKDTGHLLPGHGGVLDRLDSLIASLPFFYYLFLSH